MRHIDAKVFRFSCSDGGNPTMVIAKDIKSAIDEFYLFHEYYPCIVHHISEEHVVLIDDDVIGKLSE